MEIVHKKNTAYYLAVPMIDASTPASFKSGETVIDTAYYKDGAGAWTSLAITDTFTEIGSTGIYEIDLTAAELNHDQVLIKLTSTNSANSMVLFRLPATDISDTTSSLSAINAKTTNLPAAPAAASDCITAAGVRTAVGLASADLDTQLAALPTATEIATEIFDNTEMENTESFADQIRIMRAESAGKVSVSGATVTFRDAADTKARITATTDSNGQRTAVTVDGT